MGRLILLDPKFKRFTEAEAAQEDIDKMHTYRDAITYGGQRGFERGSKSRVEPAVSAAWCLFAGNAGNPGQDLNGGFASPLIYAYPTPDSQGASPHPYGTAGVGAFRLRPGEPTTSERLRPFLQALLETLQEEYSNTRY